MDKLKRQIQRRLLANIMIDKCSTCGRLVFRDAWCSQDRVIRFTTPFFRELLGTLPDEGGKWKTGDVVMYEAENGMDRLIVRCACCPSFVLPERQGAVEALLRVCGVAFPVASEAIGLKQWDLTRTDGDVNLEMEAYARLLDREIPRFEETLRLRIAALLDKPDEYTEGEAESVASAKYERNPAARAACLAYHGTACAVCGMDFEKAYGPDFAGKIEVHHIVPISQIGESYVVDPIRDLVPVCPNCHTALHSKKDGVYSVQELKQIRSKKKSRV